MVLWRIAVDTPLYVADDLSGAGAERTGGRWNAVGTPMVYTAPSIALTVLETLVHLAAGSLPLNRYLVKIEVPESVWATATSADPVSLVGWDAVPAGKVSIDWGTAWSISARCAIAIVPSVVVPEESNVLINPRHPDANTINAKKLRRWVYDPRTHHGLI